MKYRTYKNGITGLRYKGYYIIKGEQKGKYAIWKEDKSVFMDNLRDHSDCEWEIDKATATAPELEQMKRLYDKQIYELSEAFVRLMQKKWDTPLTEDEEKLYKLVEKIRARKEVLFLPFKGEYWHVFEDEYRKAFNEDISKLQDEFKKNIGISPVVFTYPFGAVSRESLPVS